MSADLRTLVAEAVHACESKKAEEVAILKMDASASAFTDYFIICHGTNPRQVQAIADEVDIRLGKSGAYPNNIEGYTHAEWVLLDYVDFVVHIFSAEKRRFYDLERLWRNAKRLLINDLERRPSRAAKKPVAKAVAAMRRPKPVRSAASRAVAKAIKSATTRKKVAPKKKAAKKPVRRKKK